MGRLTPKQKATKKLVKIMKRAQKEAHRLQINVDKDPELKQLLKKMKKEKKRQKSDWRKLF